MDERVVEHRTVDDIPVVDVVGDVDLNNVARLNSALEEAAAAAPGTVIVSLADASYFDSSTIHALLSFQQRAETNRKKVLLVRPLRESMRRILSIVGMEERFTIVESTAEAVARAKGPVG